MSDPFATVPSELPRDRWGRPLITPPDAASDADTVAYQRVTTFVGVLEDTYHLSLWRSRMALWGAMQRRSIQLAVSAITDPKDRFQKKTLNRLVEDSIEAANGSDAATTGTALHSLTELLDAGHTLQYVPEEFVADIEAYRAITAGVKFLDSEGFCVRDDLRVGGSYDRIARFPEPLIAPDGSSVSTAVWDLKGLAVSTFLPTPTGWTTMGDVAVGDQVFGSDGKPCTVTAKSEVKDLPTYSVEFDDGSVIMCDNEHIWWVQSGNEKTPSPKGIGDVIASVGRGEINRVPVAGPLELPHADLPIDPYLLGCWLGDGHVRDGCITKADDLFDILAEDGHSFGVRQKQPAGKEHIATRTIKGLTASLRAAGLLHNKHVPAAYLRGSVEQRTRLLQGMTDTDGSWNTARRTAVFSSTDRSLAKSYEELARSLGQRPYFAEYTARGFGLEVQAYMVSFTPVDMIPFRLPRKAEQAAASDKSTVKARRRCIVSVTAAPSVPTACIAVNSTNQTYLAGRQMIPTHNTGGNTDAGLFGMGKIAMQLGVYANSLKYDHTLGSRSPLPGDPSRTWGVVCHLPAGSGAAQLLWVDIAAGWDIAYSVAPQVHAWRKRNDLSVPFKSVSGTGTQVVTLPALIAAASSYDDLLALHAEHVLVWTPGLTQMARDRRRALEEGA